MPSPAALTVDLNALAHNFHALQAAAGVPAHPVVKADSYGLGAAPVATRLMAEGARTFFVARAAEGLALREALGAKPAIYILDGCHGDAVRDLKAADLRPILNQPAQLEAWRAAGGGPCGLQIDTGMSRLGFRPEDSPDPFAGLELVMSHLACADEPEHPMNRRQRDAFAAVSAKYRGAIRSFANSGGCFMGPDFAFDAVRPGICLYGGGPEGKADDRVKAVATFSAEVVQVRPVAAGETVGYSAGWTAPRDSTVAIVAAGYADGVLRSYSSRGQVWLAGALRPIIGRVSMDVIAVDVSGADVAVGDLCEIYGPNRNVDDQAAAAGTIAYELLTSVTPRVPRRYVG